MDNSDQIRFVVGSNVLQIHKNVLGDLIWQNVPPAATDPASEERQQIDQFLMFVPPHMIRKLVQSLLDKAYGPGRMKVQKGEDYISLITRVMISVLLRGLLSHEWELIQEDGTTPEQESGDPIRHYQIVSILARTAAESI